MCGLIFITTNKKTKKKTKTEPVNNEVIEQLEDQISRGNEGFGILMINKKNEIELKRATEISKALLDLYMTESPMIVMHHRNPTSSDNKLSQTHPILVSDGSLKHDYYVIHNGVISNADDLKEKHEKLGFIYNTVRTGTFEREEYNDSESLAIEMAMYIEKQTKEISIEGTAAFIIVQVDRKTKKAINIFFGRKDNPLNLSGRQGEVRLSSEGKGESILEETLYKFSIKSPSLTKSNLNFKNKEETKKWNWEKDKEKEKNEVVTTREQIESGTGTGYNSKKEWETKAEEEDTIDNNLEIISEEFITSTADIIEQFATKLQEISEINQIDIESEKKALAVDICINVQKSYNLALDIAQESLYTNIKEESEERIEKDDEKEKEKPQKLIGYHNDNDYGNRDY
jgi:glucosamine 6-phosphate synthetase-like amidotransferase/phosphosugar isomerase protein